MGKYFYTSAPPPFFPQSSPFPLPLSSAKITSPLSLYFMTQYHFNLLLSPPLLFPYSLSAPSTSSPLTPPHPQPFFPHPKTNQQSVHNPLPSASPTLRYFLEKWCINKTYRSPSLEQLKKKKKPYPFLQKQMIQPTYPYY